MNRNLLELVLRHADGLNAEADADALLLRRFVASRDEQAFTLLVKRHGPMVWAVCRQSVPNHADAEDAFQATFLALAQSAKGIRTPERLAGWLHAAAVRICGKAKRGFTRRTKHERATAKAESDSPVSAAAWNDLLAAVHAEVSALPPSLRLVFVLCDLEGVEPGAAAKQLGLKPGTLSGQLARARQRLLAALTKRGLAAGTVALGTAVLVPEALANKVSGGVVPSAAVVALASEITTMGVSKLKLLAAGLLVAGGLTLSGLGLLAKADGQVAAPPGVPGTPGVTPPGGVPVPGGRGGAALPGVGGPGGPGVPGLPGPGGGDEGGGPGMPGMSRGTSAPAGDHLFVGKPNTIADVAKLLKDKSAKGWEYTGPLDVDPADPPKGTEFEDISKSTRVVLVFKRKPGPVGSGWIGGMPGGSGPGTMGGPAGIGGGLPGGSTLPALGRTPGVGPNPGASGVRALPPKTGSGGGSAPPSRGSGSTDPSVNPGSSNPLGGGGEGTLPAEEKFEVIKLKNATAEEAVKVLLEVFNGPSNAPLPKRTGRVSLVADNRTNSIIVVKASASDLEIIQKLLSKTIDTEAKPEKK